MAVSFRPLPAAMMATRLWGTDCPICLYPLTTVNLVTDPDNQNMAVESLTGDPVTHGGQNGDKHPFHAVCAVRELARQRLLGQNPKCPLCFVHINGVDGIDANQIAQHIREEDEGSLATTFFKNAAGVAIVAAAIVAAGAAGAAVEVAVGGKEAVTAGEVIAFTAAGALTAAIGVSDEGVAAAIDRFQLNGTVLLSGVVVGCVTTAAVIATGVSVPIIAAIGIGIAGVTAGSVAVYQRFRG